MFELTTMELCGVVHLICLRQKCLEMDISNRREDMTDGNGASTYGAYTPYRTEDCKNLTASGVVHHRTLSSPRPRTGVARRSNAAGGGGRNVREH